MSRLASREDAGIADAVNPDDAWTMLLEKARAALLAQDDAALIACDDELRYLQEEPSVPARIRPLIELYRSLSKWKRDGRFEPPFGLKPVAKIQLWELDACCPDLAYLRAFVAESVERFGNVRGFRMFERVLASFERSASTFRDDRTQDVQIHRRVDADLTIVGFSGRNDQYAGISWGLFDRAVAERLNANLLIFRDFEKRLYLAGVRSLGNYDETVSAIRAILAEFGATRIVAAGGSGGVFGAINIAADIGIRHIVAMAGPTSLEVGEDNDDRQIYRNIAADIAAGRFARPDLVEKVNGSAVERIDFFVAGAHEFDMAQMRALADRCKVVCPYVYEDQASHIVTDLAIADGSIFTAFGARGERGLVRPESGVVEQC